MSVRRTFLVLVIGCISLGAVAAADDGPASRPAVPDAAAVQKAAKTVDALFGDDLARARAPADKSAVVKKMLAAADATKDDPAGRYALLTKAIDAAGQAGDVEAALSAVDQVREAWDVDGLKMTSDVILRAGRAARSPADAAALAGHAGEAAGDAAAADRFELAKPLADVAAAAAQRSGDKALMKQEAARAAEIADQRVAYDRAKPFLAELAANPASPVANATVGRYECFMKGNWEAGLAKLAKGNDPALKALAEQEAAAPTAEAVAQLALADGWWALAEKETGPARARARRHAADWYEKAAAGLTGLAKTKAERRAAEVAAERKGAGGGAGGGPTTRPGTTVVTGPDAKGVREAKAIVADLTAHYPDVLRGVKGVQLVKIHDATEMRRNGGGPRNIPDSYAPMAMAGKDGGPMWWGIYEKWDAGNYLIVYRTQALSEVGGDKGICFLDVCADGTTIASRRPKAVEFTPGQWRAMPVQLTLRNERTIEYRLWPDGHMIALDRIYIFRLP